MLLINILLFFTNSQKKIFFSLFGPTLRGRPGRPEHRHKILTPTIDTKTQNLKNVITIISLRVPETSKIYFKLFYF